MARVTVAQSMEIAKRSKGVRMFNFKPGELYHILFLGEEVNGETHPIMYMNPTHNVKKDGKGFEARCSNVEHNSSQVILTDENGELLINEATGNPVNDGTCPYCELQDMYATHVFKLRDDFMEANPDATEKQVKDYTSELFKSAPVADFKNTRVMMAVVFELDERNKIKTDSEGNKLYSIMGVKFTEHRFDVKMMEAVQIKKMGLDDESDHGIAWHEYYFKFPEADGDKMLSGKDLAISPTPNPVLPNDPKLRGRIEEELSEIDLDALEEMMFIYKLRSLDEMNRDIAPQLSLVKDMMSETDIDQAKEKLGEDTTVTDDEIERVMGTSKSETSTPNENGQAQETSTEQETEQPAEGEEAFATDDSLGAVQNLM